MVPAVIAATVAPACHLHTASLEEMRPAMCNCGQSECHGVIPGHLASATVHLVHEREVGGEPGGAVGRRDAPAWLRSTCASGSTGTSALKVL